VTDRLPAPDRMWGSDMRPALALLVAALPLAAQAQTPMTAKEFEAFATGKTLDFANEAGVFGTEEYLPGRRVRWAGTNDTCKFGKWYEDAGNICFVYDGLPDRYCWTIWRVGDRLATLPVPDPFNAPPRSIAESAGPLACAGPDVGV
jgi:hypothetical protein